MKQKYQQGDVLLVAVTKRVESDIKKLKSHHNGESRTIYKVTKNEEKDSSQILLEEEKSS